MRTLSTLLFLLAGLAPAQEIERRPPMIPRPPLPPRPPRMVQLESVAVEATIQEAGVQTEVKALFRNPGQLDGEADWVFPLPPGSIVHSSRLLVNGKEMAAETLGADQARQVYQAIVAKLRDPLLLEYAGWGMVRARIFPVPAGGQAEARFSMTALLPEAGGVREYLFPFKALAASGSAPRSLAARVSLSSARALGAIYSPTPGAEVRKRGETEAVVGWEGSGLPERDLQVFFSPAEKEFGLLPLFHAHRGGEGTFMAVLSPAREGADAKPIPKTLVFVVDTSGSMQGAKIAQAKGALRFFLGSLAPEDAFNLIPFSSEARPLFASPRALTEETRKEALDAIERIEAAGGTNIHDALAQAMNLAQDDRLPIVLFLTDGQPTVGETDAARILSRIKDANTRKARLFVLGVGNDVNAFLLDRLAEEGKGDRHYVREDEDLEVKTASLLARLSRPALSDLRLRLEGGSLDKLTPFPLPDLFHGMTLTVLGEFRGSGNRELVLEGTVLGKQRSWRFPVALPESPTAHTWLEPLWAQRRVAQLLDQIRLFGQSKELVDEAVKLGKEYGIVTPWTSHLVAEEAERLARGADMDAGPGWARDARRAGEQGGGGLLGGLAGGRAPATGAPTAGPATPSAPATPPAPQSGAEAVTRSKLLDSLKKAEAPQLELADQAGGAGGGRVRRVAGKLFLLLEETWVDQAFEPAMKAGMRTIEAFSPDYFALLEQHPEANRWLAPGGRILIVLGGAAYLITP